MTEESSTNFYDTNEDVINNTPVAKTGTFLIGTELKEMDYTESPVTKTSKKASKKWDEPKKPDPEPPQPEDPRFKYKQVILVRTDLNLSPGKLAVQVAHASVNAFNATSPLTRKSWLDEGHRKIVLQVADATALTHFYTQARSLGLPTSLIVDFGLEGKQASPSNPTGIPTTVAIGPALNEAIDPLTAQLKLY